MTRAATFIIALLAILAAPQLVAQEELNDDRKIERHREIPQALTEPVYRRLNTIHEHMTEGRYDEALADLSKLEKVPLKKYEEALVLQTYGFAYVQQAMYKEAQDYIERCLAMEALPGAATQGMLYSLASLYLADSEYEKAIATMRRWFRYEEEPIADAYMVIASAFSEMQQFEAALPYVQKAIELAEEPNEGWYKLELAIYFDAERYRDAVVLLKQMVRLWPDAAEHWDVLVAAYIELKEDKNALDAMMVSYTKGHIKTESKLKALAQLNMLLDIPFAAGQILEKAMADGIVEPTQENLDILLQAWLSAKEYDKATAAIERLGPLADDGSYFMQEAGIFNERGEWAKVPPAIEKAIEMGLDEPSPAYMLAGMAHTELRQYGAALTAFRNARRFGDTKQRSNASAWIEFVEDKVAVQRAALD